MKRKLFVTFMSLFVIGIFLLMILSPAQDYSSSERRKLATLPEISFESISTGKFMNEFEDYTLDQFPLRDTFRTIKASIQNHLFLRKDNNDYVYTQNHLTKLEYPYMPSNIDYAAKKFNYIYIVGGGAKNKALNDFTEEITGKKVVALPIEATAIGNLKSQFKTGE